MQKLIQNLYIKMLQNVFNQNMKSQKSEITLIQNTKTEYKISKIGNYTRLQNPETKSIPKRWQQKQL